MFSPLSIAFALFIFSLVRVTTAASSFGGLNHGFLQFLGTEERDNIVNNTVTGQASAIRIIIRGLDPSEISIKGSTTYPQSDPETSLGEFNSSLLDAYDDVFYSVYKISQGNLKIIIAPHDAKSLQRRNGLYCDGYCDAVQGDWQSFYTDQHLRAAYKDRLTNIFNNYKSKNFNGTSWSELSKVILGVDLQNEPWSGVSPIPSGEDWICDIATHLNQTVGLGRNNILTISGGISGKDSATGEENWPSSAFLCPTLDVIAIHGAFEDTSDSRAETPWAKMLLPEMPLAATAADPRYNKRVLVEEWSYKPSTEVTRPKAAALSYIGEVFALRGIPALYASIISTHENCTICEPSDVNILSPCPTPSWTCRTTWFAVQEAVGRMWAFKGQSGARFNWSSLAYSRPNYDGGYPLNNIGRRFDEYLGNLGYLCSLYRYCPSNTVCNNDICEPCNAGCVGQACPCLRDNQCVNGTCTACGSTNSSSNACLGGSCVGVPCASMGFCMMHSCLDCFGQNCPTNPCKVHRDCGTAGFCEQGLCQQCGSRKGCLGQACVNDDGCLNGSKCSVNGICEYTSVTWPEDP